MLWIIHLILFCKDRVQDDRRQGDDAQSEEESQFTLQYVLQIEYKIDRCEIHDDPPT